MQLYNDEILRNIVDILRHYDINLPRLNPVTFNKYMANLDLYISKRLANTYIDRLVFGDYYHKECNSNITIICKVFDPFTSKIDYLEISFYNTAIYSSSSSLPDDIDFPQVMVRNLTHCGSFDNTYSDGTFVEKNRNFYKKLLGRQ
jgi:hypothetical protein